MKTSYNILWIDDEPDTVDTDQKDVQDYLEKSGIEAVINFVEAAPDSSGIKESLKLSLKDPDLDLLVVDFKMDGLAGDKLVEYVRESGIYLPVILYSTSSVEDLFDAVRSTKLDGVYIANREFLIHKVKAVVDSLLAKEQTVQQVRGLLMESASEVDAQFFEIFEKNLKGIDGDKKSELKNYLIRKRRERAKEAKNNLEKLPSDVKEFDNYSDRKDIFKNYDSFTKWRATSKILELAGHSEEDLAEFKKFVEGPESLQWLRNEYAHKTRKDLSYEHTPERCINIRKTLRAQFKIIDAIIMKSE